jgi:hypothetical protein
MQIPTPTSGLAQAIQLAVAPVFLLSAVGIFLGVLTNRLSRIVDRARLLDAATAEAVEGTYLQGERKLLDRRRRLILQAISMCTYSAVLIASVVAALFLGAFIRIDLTDAVAWAFVAAMVTFIVGLLNFLWEVQAALRWVRRGSSLD